MAIADSAVFEFNFEEVHGRRANKASNEDIVWCIVNFLRATDLLDNPIFHDDNPASHGHSFCLVVGNVDGSGVQALV